MYFLYEINLIKFFKNIDFDFSNTKNNEINLIKTIGANNNITFYNCSWRAENSLNVFKINLTNSFVFFDSCLFEFERFNLYKKQIFFNFSWSKILMNQTILRFLFLNFY